jgi:hypothetical protein
MTGIVPLSLGDGVVIILAIFFLAFTSFEYLVKNFILKALLQGSDKDVFSSLKHVRAVSAESMLKFASLIIRVSATLTFALGVAKTFSVLIPAFLPANTFGLSTLISYCGMVNIIHILKPDLEEYFYSHFNGKNQI